MRRLALRLVGCLIRDGNASGKLKKLSIDLQHHSSYENSYTRFGREAGVCILMCVNLNKAACVGELATHVFPQICQGTLDSSCFIFCEALKFSPSRFPLLSIT